MIIAWLEHNYISKGKLQIFVKKMFLSKGPSRNRQSVFRRRLVIPPTSDYCEVRFGMKKYKEKGCGAVWVYYKPIFRRNMSPPSSR
jgi:hypothetical protein